MRTYIPKNVGEAYAFKNEIPLADVMDKNIIITRFFIREQNYQGNTYDSLTFEFHHPDKESEMFVSRTASAVLIKQLQEEKETGLPVKVRITKRKNYYTLSAPQD